MHSCYTKSPTQKDVIAVHRIFLYLAGTPSLGIRLESGEGIILYATLIENRIRDVHFILVKICYI